MSATLGELVAQYLDWLEVHHYAKLTKETRQTELRRFLGWCEARGLARPIEVTRPIVERYQRSLATATKRDGKPLSKQSQVHLLVAVRVFFKWLFRQKLIPHNPAADLELPRRDRNLPAQLLTAEEVERVLNAIEPASPLALRDRAMLETLYSTGLRRAELAALDLEHVDLERGLVTVRKGKGGKDRVVPIGQRALAWLVKYLEEARPGLEHSETERAIFVVRGGGRVGTRTVSIICAGRVKAAGIEKHASSHAFRHSAATGMLEGGADIRFIQALLGHEQLSSTQIYTRVAIQKLKEVHTRTHPAKSRRTKSPG